MENIVAVVLVVPRESKRQIICELKVEIFPTSQPKPWQVMSPGETATSSCPRHLHKALANCGAAILMFERAIIVEICFHFLAILMFERGIIVEIRFHFLAILEC